MKCKVWILTREENQYDQYGEYYVAAFETKPTHQQLTDHGVERKFLRHTLNGGGRTAQYEDTWFHLREEELK